MSLTSTTNRADFGVTSATNFPYNFKVFDATDLEVYRTDSTGVQTLVSPALYTVNGVGTETGSIDYATHDATDLGLVILRVVDETQPTVLRGQSTFYADVVEKALDRLVMISQQIRETFNRTLKMPVGFTGSTTLPGAQEGYVLGWVGGVLTNLSAATAQLSADLLSAVSGKGASLVNYLAPFTGAVARLLNLKLAERVSLEDFGAVGDGVADDAPAFVKASATGKTIWLQAGKNYVINTPTTISVDIRGEGPYTGKSIITLTGTGQLIPGAWHLTWEGFWLKSTVASLTFIKLSQSYFTMRNFRVGGSSTDSVSAGQTGIEFDFSAGSVYFADITLYKIQNVAYPFKFTGPASVAQSLSSCRIGSSLRDDLQTFVTAWTFTGAASIVIDNTFQGYLENASTYGAGKTAFIITGISKFRDNRVNVLLDEVATLITNDTDIKAPNWWTVRTDNIIKTGAGLLTQQVWQNNKARFRVYRTAAQSLPDATYDRIAWDTASFDEGGNPDGNGIPTGCFNVTASPIVNTPFANKEVRCFTAINAMKLQAYAQMEVIGSLADVTQVRLALYKNAAATAEAITRAGGSGAGVRLSVSDIIDLAPGDTVSVWAYADTTGSNTDITVGSANTYFMGHEL